MNEQKQNPQNYHEWWVAGNIPQSGEVALDIGAGFGVYTKTFVKRFKHVIAFEPHPANRKMLEEEMKGKSNITVRPEAVLDFDGTVDLYFHKLGDAEDVCRSSVLAKHPVSPTKPTGEKIAVSCVRIDSLAMPGHVSFVKIDVEGAEVKVLLGARDTIAAHRPELMIEVHSLDNIAPIENLLAALEYEWKRINHPSDIPVPWLWIYAKPK